MSQILISGNNRISEFLHNALADKGCAAVDTNQVLTHKASGSNAAAIVDVTHADIIDGSLRMLYTVSETKELIDLAKKLDIPYLFVYRESEGLNVDSPVLGAIDLIEKHGPSINLKYVKILVEDVYGVAINTCAKLQSFINSIVDDQPLTIENDNREYYLLNQTDFASGIIKTIELLNSARTQKYGTTYTLIPEEPITELELAHFINDLNDLPKEMIFSREDSGAEATPLELEVNYPENWYPKIDLESGLKAVMDFFGIPIIGTEREELAEDEFRLRSQEPEQKNFLNSYDKDDEYLFVNADPTQHSFDDDDPKAVPSKKGTAKTNHKYKITSLALVLAGILVVPSLMFAFNLNNALKSLDLAMSSFNSYDMKTSQTSSQDAIRYISKTKDIPALSGLFLPLFKTNDKELAALVDTTEKSARAINLISSDFNSYANTIQNNNSHVLGASTQENNSDTSLELIDSIQTANVKSSNEWVNNWMNRITASLYKNKENIAAISKVQKYIPQILGYKNTQKYLILMSNSKRSLGAFNDVDLYATAEIKEGKFDVKSVEKIDKMTDYMDLNNLYVGKDNMPIKSLTWSPNFESNSRNIYKIYKLIENQDINGIFYADKEFFKSMSGTDEDLDTSNAKDRIEALFLNERISNADMVNNLIMSLHKKDLILSHKDDAIASALMQNNWSGGFIEQYDDYIYVLNSDEGSKSSRTDGLKMSMNYSTNKPDHNVYTRELSLNYENTGGNDILKKVRVFLPQNTSMNDVRLIEGDSDKKIVKNVEAYPYETKYVFSTDLQIKAGAKITLKYLYESPEKGTEDGSINLVIQKQQGSQTVPIGVTFNYPEGIPAFYKAPRNAIINNNAIQVNEDLEKDTEVDFPL